ncbi:hypothetical protein LTR09_009586 [Extremus antarcticus]|uniref:Zinc finger Mcm10/DnaG-type domain-containing protein n=1 Tax=Extremus antarcticus TaxID=702011 RepID=A0AAJ0G647_9PEZI|nr:hypothetical protein LTR09_009586 [Extremus antarcticus]
MPTIRESPRAKVSPSKNSTQWPPKSPFQALLSSPSGRRKWQDHKSARERSVSPSPVKMRPLEELQIATHDFAEFGEEEDEETLELKLQAIQTKLKLKRLREQKVGTGGGEDGRRSGSETAKLGFESVRPASSPRKTATQPRPRSQVDDIEVPLSPTKERHTQPAERVGPARERLGLTAERRAQDISLKRARDGAQIKRTESLKRAQEATAPKLSFSERLNQTRAEAQEKQDKEDRIEKSRSKGFGSTTPTFQTPGAIATALGGRATPRTTTSETKRPRTTREPESLAKLENDIALATTSQSIKPSKRAKPTIPRANGVFSPDDKTPDSHEPPSSSNSEATPGFDPFTQIHLSERHMSHTSVARAMEDREVYPLPRLLKEVKAPDYDPPDCEADFVVLAILASKSSPFDQKSAHKTSESNKPQEDADGPRNKFMVLHLCDGAKWEVDCFLFGSAFERFWKLTPGTLLAILNPGIMPPKGNKHSGGFSLKIGSSEDSVLEIGIARDLGYCESVKKDGGLCGEWVDKRKTGICEFHLNLEIERSRRGRMEVNTMGRAGKGKGGEEHRPNRRNGRAAGGWDKEIGKEKGKNSNVQNSREFGRLYSMAPSAAGGFGRGVAKMLDAEDMDAMHGMSKEEASRKRIAEAQKERDLAEKLGQMGKGVGAEYLRHTTKTTTTTTTSSGKASGASVHVDGQQTPYFEKPSAAALGLLANKAADQRLSPPKDRRKHFGLGAVSTAGTEAMGWGGARKYGLLQPKENKRLGSPERGQTTLALPRADDGGVEAAVDARVEVRRPGIVRVRSTGGDGRLSPKKRARFALEKGIREPGRESLGTVVGKGVDDNEDDDDDLDIV